MQILLLIDHSWQNVKKEVRDRNNKLYVSGKEKVTTGGRYQIFKRHRRIKKKKSKTGEINFKVETIISTSTMINIVMLAQFE